jgi:hypothetical protein
MSASSCPLLQTIHTCSATDRSVCHADSGSQSSDSSSSSSSDSDGSSSSSSDSDSDSSSGSSSSSSGSGSSSSDSGSDSDSDSDEGTSSGGDRKQQKHGAKRRKVAEGSKGDTRVTGGSKQQVHHARGDHRSPAARRSRSSDDAPGHRRDSDGHGKRSHR